MQLDELDRLLGEEGNISPSPKFAAAVMSQVLREAQAPKAIGFPWKPVLVGITSGAVALGVGGGFTLDTAPGVLTARADAMTAWIQSWTVPIAAAASSPIAGALVLALVVALIPMAVYEGYQRMSSPHL